MTAAQVNAPGAAGPGPARRLRAPKWLLAGPSIFWYLAFFVVPILFIVLYSLGTKNAASTSGVPVDLGSLTLQNYRDAFSDTFFKTFRATIRIAITATVLCTVIGLPVAYFLAFKVSEKWRAILLAMIIIPSFTSFLIRTLAWRIPLAPNGTLSKWLQDWGVISGPIQLLETQTAVQIALVYNYLGFMILPLFVALDRIEPGLREASKDLGAGRVGTFLRVTFPLAGPGIAAGVLLTFIPMCGDFVTAVVLGGADGNMIGAMIDSQFKGAQDWPLGSAMAVVMIGAVLLVLGIGAAIVLAVRAVLDARRRVILPEVTR
jgi:spermidine/putrescine transport system permease protein